jgi:hypothetical protein
MQSQPVSILTVNPIKCTYQEGEHEQVIEGTLLVLQSKNPQSESIDTFLDIMPSSEESAGITVPLVTRYTEYYYERKHPKIILTTKPIMVWTMTIELLQLDDLPQLDGLADMLGNIISSDSRDLLNQKTTGVPPQSLVLMGRDGNIVGYMENENPVVENLPSSLAPDAVVVFDQSNSQINTISQTNSKTVKLGRTLEAGIVAGAGMIGSGIKAGANFFVKNTAGSTSATPVSPQTTERVQQLQKVSGQVAVVTKGAAKVVKDVAGAIGGKLAQAMGQGTNGDSKSKMWKLARNTSLAVDAIGNGLEKALVTLVDDSKTATSNIVGHKYGVEAKHVADSALNIVQNATLIYIDVSGVSRKAIVKGIGQGALKYRMKDGSKVSISNNNKTMELELPPTPNSTPSNWDNSPSKPTTSGGYVPPGSNYASGSHGGYKPPGL